MDFIRGCNGNITLSVSDSNFLQNNVTLLWTREGDLLEISPQVDFLMWSAFNFKVKAQSLFAHLPSPSLFPTHPSLLPFFLPIPPFFPSFPTHLLFPSPIPFSYPLPFSYPSSPFTPFFLPILPFPLPPLLLHLLWDVLWILKMPLGFRTLLHTM